jgi:hypothetical protein
LCVSFELNLWILFTSGIASHIIEGNMSLMSVRFSLKRISILGGGIIIYSGIVVVVVVIDTSCTLTVVLGLCSCLLSILATMFTVTPKKFPV